MEIAVVPLGAQNARIFDIALAHSRPFRLPCKVAGFPGKLL